MAPLELESKSPNSNEAESAPDKKFKKKKNIDPDFVALVNPFIPLISPAIKWSES